MPAQPKTIMHGLIHSACTSLLDACISPLRSHLPLASMKSEIRFFNLERQAVDGGRDEPLLRDLGTTDDVMTELARRHVQVVLPHRDGHPAETTHVDIVDSANNKI